MLRTCPAAESSTQPSAANHHQDPEVQTHSCACSCFLSQRVAAPTEHLCLCCAQQPTAPQQPSPTKTPAKPAPATVPATPAQRPPGSPTPDTTPAPVTAPTSEARPMPAAAADTNPTLAATTQQPATPHSLPAGATRQPAAADTSPLPPVKAVPFTSAQLSALQSLFAAGPGPAPAPAPGELRLNSGLKPHCLQLSDCHLLPCF